MDTDSKAADALGTQLARAGHAVRIAYDAASAVLFATRLPPDVAVLALDESESDILEVAERLRDLPLGHAVRLLAITNGKPTRDSARMAKIGFEALFLKPADAGNIAWAISHRPSGAQHSEEAAQAQPIDHHLGSR